MNLRACYSHSNEGCLSFLTGSDGAWLAFRSWSFFGGHDAQRETRPEKDTQSVTPETRSPRGVTKTVRAYACRGSP